MATIDNCRQMALSLPEVQEVPHVDKPSFRVGKKIFATLNTVANRVCVKLSEVDQDVFSAFDRTLIHPVPNKWGKQGWTLLYLHGVPDEMLLDALTTAYCEVAPKHLAALVQSPDSPEIL